MPIRQVDLNAMFPIELFDMIIDTLLEDRQALRNFTLVHRSWRPRSRKHLFSLITLVPIESNGLRTFCNTISALQDQMSYPTRACVLKLVVLGCVLNNDEDSVNQIDANIVQELLRILPKVAVIMLNGVLIRSPKREPFVSPHCEDLHQLDYLTLKNCDCNAGIFDMLSLFKEITTMEVTDCDSLLYEDVQVLSFPEIHNLIIQEDTTEYFIRSVFWASENTRLCCLHSVTFPICTGEGRVEWDSFFSEIGSSIPKIKIRVYPTLLSHLNGIQQIFHEEEIDGHSEQC